MKTTKIICCQYKGSIYQNSSVATVLRAIATGVLLEASFAPVHYETQCCHGPKPRATQMGLL